VSIRVDGYDSRWPGWFEAERSVLEPVLRPWLSGGIHHVGSTAVPGLAAKPILDLIAGVRDLTEAHAAIPALAALSYQHAPHRPRALYFGKSADGAPHADACHLHLTEPGSDLWQERLAFRDALRADPELAARYQQLKQDLARTAPDLERYSAGKRSFVADVLARAGISL
jgi:GrpB-like predicted nucleotidyltransferase (UPF0157 family)